MVRSGAARLRHPAFAFYGYLRREMKTEVEGEGEGEVAGKEIDEFFVRRRAGGDGRKEGERTVYPGVSAVGEEEAPLSSFVFVTGPDSIVL